MSIFTFFVNNFKAFRIKMKSFKEKNPENFVTISNKV